MLKSNENVRVRLLYEYKSGHSEVETTRNICNALGPSTIEPTTAYRWFDSFRNGDQSLQENPKPDSDRPTTIDLKQLKHAT